MTTLIPAPAPIPRTAVISTTVTPEERARLEQFAWDNKTRLARVVYQILEQATDGFTNFSAAWGADPVTPPDVQETGSP